MNGYTLAKLPDEPIVITTMLESWVTRTDVPAITEELSRLLDGVDEPVFYVSDASQLPKFNIDDLVWATNQVSRTANAILHNPKIRENLVVTTNRALQLAFKGMDSVTFGNVHISTFDTVDSALAYARSHR